MAAMDELHCSVYEYWSDPAFLDVEHPEKFPGSAVWDQMRGPILAQAIGPEASTGKQFRHGVVEYFQFCLRAIRDRLRHTRIAQQTKMLQIEQKITGVLGANALTTCVIPTGLDVAECRTLLGELDEWKRSTQWLAIGKQDLEILQTPVNLTGEDAALRLKQRWAALSPDARRKDFCPYLVGFLTEIVERKTGREIEVDLEDDNVSRE